MSQHAEAGYSLVELVIAMLLLGLIALAVENGLHFGATVWERSQTQISSTEGAVEAHAILRNLLSHSLPRLNGAYVTFDGAPGRLAFDVVPPQAFQSEGTARATLTITRHDSRDTLLLSLAPLASPNRPKQATVVEDTHGLRFAYLDASEGAGTWLSRWQDRTKLPDAVRVSTDDPALWPTLVVRLSISQSNTCSLDPVSMTCRKM